MVHRVGLQAVVQHRAQPEQRRGDDQQPPLEPHVDGRLLLQYEVTGKNYGPNIEQNGGIIGLADKAIGYK